MQPPPPPSRTANTKLDKLRSLLRQILRVTANDGRVFLGTFAGTDKSLNVLLINTEEYRLGQGGMYEGRFVGQVMVPWHVVDKVEAQTQTQRQVLSEAIL